MSELLYELREVMPQTQLVLMAPLPKGEYWPNRCTPAFCVFNEALQVLPHPHNVATACFSSGSAQEPHCTGCSTS